MYAHDIVSITLCLTVETRQARESLRRKLETSHDEHAALLRARDELAAEHKLSERSRGQADLLKTKFNVRDGVIRTQLVLMFTLECVIHCQPLLLDIVIMCTIFAGAGRTNKAVGKRVRALEGRVHCS